MTHVSLLVGALIAAPLVAQHRMADPVVEKGRLVWFSLTEKQEQVAKRIGPPVSVADFGDDYQAWHYRIGDGDHHDFTHYLVFRRSTKQLVSVTRAFEPEQKVDLYFPASRTTVHYLRESQFGARVRDLGDGRLLIATGSAERGQAAGQLMLIGAADLRYFHPWLHEQLAAARPQRK